MLTSRCLCFTAPRVQYCHHNRCICVGDTAVFRVRQQKCRDPVGTFFQKPKRWLRKAMIKRRSAVNRGLRHLRLGLLPCVCCRSFRFLIAPNPVMCDSAHCAVTRCPSKPFRLTCMYLVVLFYHNPSVLLRVGRRKIVVIVLGASNTTHDYQDDASPLDV